ncbi:hypothetical protein FRC11_008021 [Ceratobasidium sp. 423]|nr:hypothetical protein FRC11_008021 [Ceratobasidium sp. 423]
MNAYLPEHSGQDSSAAFEQGMYDWHPENVHLSASQAPYNGVSMRTGYPEHEFAMTPSPQFQYNPTLPQRTSYGGLPQVGDVDYRGSSPHSAPPSGGNSPWNTGPLPTQEVMYHPEVEISKFNRGSRGSMNSLSLTSMRTSHPLASGHAYTSKMGMRPHAMSLSNAGPTDEQPWNLIPCTMPFAQDGVGSAGIPGVAGASFFLRSPTPTKRQRTNQACEKCRERKAKRMPPESVIRYAQSMPQIGYRYGQSHDGFAEHPTGAWNPPADNQTMANLNVPEHHPREDAVSSDYPTADMQTLHYSVSDVSSSSTPITPDRFEYTWPPAGSTSPQQSAFAFGHNDNPQPMLPIPEFEGESNSLGELRVWTGSHSDKHPIMMPSGPENDQQNTLV